MGNEPRPSMDSGRRSISFGFGRKRSGSIAGSAGASSTQEKPKRSSLLPGSFSLKAIGIGKEYGTPGAPPEDVQFYDNRVDSSGGYAEQQAGRGQSRGTTAGNGYNRDSPQLERHITPTATPPQHQRYASQGQVYNPQPGNPQQIARQYQAQESLPTQDPSLGYQSSAQNARYPTGFNDYEADDRRQTGSRSGRGVLQKNNRKFTDAYEQEQDQGYGAAHHNNAGSSGAARKVMDFFRRRGKARTGSE